MSSETYYLSMAVIALSRAVHELAMETADYETFKRVCKELDVVERAVEQAGLHVIKEDA